MTKYGVTGASGKLGKLVVESLIAKGVRPEEIVAVARTVERCAPLAESGVEVRPADYSEPETLESALAGVDRLLLVSGTEFGQRVEQHSAVIDAAKAAGVGRLAYTSVLRAGTSELPVAPEHKATEALIEGSGLAHTLLRNGWYIENYTDQLPVFLQTGAILGAAGGGRISAACRADYAEAAAEALLHESPHVVYELGGPAFTLAELAAAVSEVTGVSVVYRDLSPADLVAALTSAGLDPATASFFAAIDVSAAAGALETDSTDLETLLGRPVVPLREAIRRAHSAL